MLKEQNLEVLDGIHFAAAVSGALHGRGDGHFGKLGLYVLQTQNDRLLFP